MKRSPVRVLVVDDSAMMRELLSSLLNEDPEIEVVGTASDGSFVEARCRSLSPDVITLDLMMPKLDGMSALRRQMAVDPRPVVVVSAATEPGAASAFEALAAGAVDCIGKPEGDGSGDVSEYAKKLRAVVKAAAAARVERHHGHSLLPATSARQRASLRAGGAAQHGVLHAHAHAGPGTSGCVIAMGASTGGTVALERILKRLPGDAPPIVMTQHIPKRFSGALARRLDGVGPVRVVEATDGLPIHRGHAYLAPGDLHLCLALRAGGYECRLSDAPPVQHHRPSVDVLFRSVAQAAGKHAVGVLLTGMGSDGARGLREIRDRGGLTLAQDEASSVIWGMPKAAIDAGGVCRVLSLLEIPAHLCALGQRAFDP